MPHVTPRKSALRTVLEWYLPLGAVWLLGCVASVICVPISLAVAIHASLWSSEAASRPRVTIEDHRPGQGREGEKDTLLLVHGWPDSPRLWDGVVQGLVAKGYRCLVASMPGAQGDRVDSATTLEDVSDALWEELVRYERKPVTLLIHDWGAVFGFLLAERYPESVTRIAALEVGGHYALDGVPLQESLALLGCHIVLACAFLVGWPVGTYGVRALAWLWGYPPARPYSELTADMSCHDLSLFFSEAVRMWKNQSLRPSPSLDYSPAERQVPCLFVYGTKKPFMYHTDEWVARVEASPFGEVQSMDCGHWLMLEQPREFMALLQAWLDRSQSRARRAVPRQ
mmetsp:Transcript_19198/g.60833  ORF Transcript_19198/g.60833 Transcript_19198/m.60833 type:complete len:341 (+) Transcript_19198:39-1061(+)